MDTYVINGVCRCCASQGSSKDIDTSYTWMGGEEIYSKMLRDCFDIALSRSVSGHDGGICELCVTQLRNAYNFKKQVVSTEEMLKKRLNSDQFKPSLVKVELEVHPERISDSDNDMGDHMDQDSGDDHSTKEFLVPIKSEVQEAPEVKPKRRATKAGTSAAKKPKLEAETSKSEQRISPKMSQNSEDETMTKPRKGEELDKHRQNVRIILQYSNATPIRCKNGMGYVCSFCMDSFPEPKDLKMHTLERHDEKSKLKFMKNKPMMGYVVKLDITGLRCEVCAQNIETLNQLIDHLITEHDKKIHTDIKNHILPFKFGDDVLRCIFCASHFSKFKTLQEHMNAHYRNYVCPVCDAGFVNRGYLHAHKYKHSTGVFKCDYCPKVLESHFKKQKHEKVVHVHKGKTSKCTYCGEKFSVYSTRNEHMVKVHGAKPLVLKCQACDKTFSKRCALTRHTKRDHLMERRHECTDCDKRFFSKKQLCEHSAKHSGQKNFTCDVCAKSYSRKTTLREHLRIHSNDRRFGCQYCSQTFIQKCSLKGHLKSRHSVFE